MRAHGSYSLTSTTTSMLFGSRALLEIVRHRRRDVPGASAFHIDHADWFTAHQEVAGVPYSAMSASARAGFEHRQDVLVEYGAGVVRRVVEGPAPRTALDVTIYSADSSDGPAEFGYSDTLSVPKVDVYNRRVIRFRMLEYDSMLVFDEVTGISVRPIGFLGAVFSVLGKPDIEQTRLATSGDWWQVMRGRVRVFPGISRTGIAVIEPGGLGHQALPAHRTDLRALARGLRAPLELIYGPPSCRVRRIVTRRQQECRQVMGGLGNCPPSTIQ